MWTQPTTQTVQSSKYLSGAWHCSTHDGTQHMCITQGHTKYFWHTLKEWIEKYQYKGNGKYEIYKDSALSNIDVNFYKLNI